MNQTAPDIGWGDHTFEWTFARGHLDRLRIGYLTPAFAALLKKSSLSALLRTLVVVDPSDGELSELEEYADKDWDYDDTPGLAALGGTRFDNLRTFILSEDEDSNCHIGGGDAHRLLKAMPRLEHLQIDAHYVNLGPVMKASLPELRTLDLRHTAARYPLEVLARNKTMGNLQRLAIHPHAREYDDDVDGAYIDFDGLRALCRSKNVGSLRHLSLKLTDFGDEGVRELLKSPLFQQLQTIDFEYGMISDEGAALLAEADLSHLESLNVSGNYITKEGVDLLRAASKKVTADEQLSGDPHDEQEHLWYGDIE